MKENKNTEIEKHKEVLQPYFDEFLNPALKTKEFSEEQILVINDEIIKSNLEKRKKAEEKRQLELAKNPPPQAKNASEDIENSIQKAFKKLAENPIEILKVFQSNKGWQPVLDFIVSLSVIGALVYLAGCGHLDNSQTATLLGGIVGYLLGHTRR